MEITRDSALKCLGLMAGQHDASKWLIITQSSALGISSLIFSVTTFIGILSLVIAGIANP
jgi:hypothetical protein